MKSVVFKLKQLLLTRNEGASGDGKLRWQSSGCGSVLNDCIKKERVRIFLNTDRGNKFGKMPRLHNFQDGVAGEGVSRDTFDAVVGQNPAF